MRRFTQLVITVGLVASPMARAATFDLEMDHDPVTDGWTVANSGSGTHSVSGGLLTINSPDFYEFNAPAAVKNAMSNSGGWSLDARFRIVSGATSDELRMWLHDKTDLNVLTAGTSDLRLYDIPDHVIPFNIGNTFHTYHMEAMGKHVTASVDGQTVFDVTHAPGTGGTQNIFFGDGVFSGSTVSEWDYVRITSPVPEPAAATLLGTLGLTLARRRRSSLRARG